MYCLCCCNNIIITIIISNSFGNIRATSFRKKLSVEINYVAHISFGCSCTYAATIIYYINVIFSSHVGTRSNYTQVRTYIICLRYLMTFNIDYYSSGWRTLWYLYCAYPIYIVCKIRYMQKRPRVRFLFYLVLFLCFSHP